MVDFQPSDMNGPLTPLPRLRVKKSMGGGFRTNCMFLYFYFCVWGGWGGYDIRSSNVKEDIVLQVKICSIVLYLSTTLEFRLKA